MLKMCSRGSTAMFKNIHTSIAIVTLVSSVFVSAHAEWYMGVDKLPASDWYQIDDYSIDTTGNKLDAIEPESAFKLYSGFKAHELLTLEFEYQDQMHFGVGNVFSGRELWLSDESDVKLESKALFFSGSSTFAIDENTRIHLRGGLYNWDLKPESNHLDENAEAERGGTDIFYSIGSYFDVTEKIGFSAEWERFEFENEDVDFISTELHFNF